MGSVLAELLPPGDSVALRPAGPSDTEFLYEVYASTRAEELAPVPWSAAQKDTFLRQQFGAQDAHYRQQRPETEFLVILDGGEPIGRLYVHESADQLMLMDIALLPEHRGQGIGARLVEALLARARARDVPVTLHVEAENPARRLYERLGFVDEGEDGFYRRMRWSAPAGASRQAKTAS